MPNHSYYHKICPLIEQGKTNSEIAAELNCSGGPITRARKKLCGAKPKPPRYDWDAIQAYYDEGHSRKECLQKFGMATSAWTRAEQKKTLRVNPSRINKRNDNKDLTNRRFGYLVVLGLDGVKTKRGAGRYWRCQCDCGSLKSLPTAYLNAGHLSCGCAAHRRGNKSHLWKGHGEISARYWANIQNNARSSVRTSVIPFEISIEYAWDLFLQQKSQCAISGVPIKMNSINAKQTASLDRIDSNKGYIEGNVQWVHKWVNIMKLDHTMEEFLYWIETIYHYQHGKHTQ